MAISKISVSFSLATPVIAGVAPPTPSAGLGTKFGPGNFLLDWPTTRPTTDGGRGGVRPQSSPTPDLRPTGGGGGRALRAIVTHPGPTTDRGGGGGVL